MSTKDFTESDFYFNNVMDRLKTASKASSYNALGEFLGLSSSAFANYKKRNSIPYDHLVSFCASQKISIDWVLTGNPSEFMSKPQPGSGSFDDFVLIPLYDVEASAGHGSLVYSDAISCEMAFRRDWLEEKRLQPNHCALIKARGDSMKPTIHDGNLLLVDTLVDKVIDDAIYVISTDHLLLVKRIQLSTDGSLLILSDNPAYKTMTVNDPQSVKINGRVRWIGHQI